MPEQSLRFSVRNEDGHRAATWKLFTRTGRGKSDVYLLCRPLGGKLKMSFHESGSWHVAFERKYLEEHLDKGHPRRDDRYLDRWPRPHQISPGVTLACRIVVPTTGVNTPIEARNTKSMVWVPAAPVGKAVELAVVFTEPGAVVSDWPGRNSMNTALVGKLAIENEETVWIVHRVVEAPDIDFPEIASVTPLESAGAADASSSNARILVFADGTDGSRAMIDCAFQGRT